MFDTWVYKANNGVTFPTGYVKSSIPLKVPLGWLTICSPVVLLKAGHELKVTAADLLWGALENKDLAALFSWHQPALYMASFQVFLESFCC